MRKLRLVASAFVLCLVFSAQTQAEDAVELAKKVTSEGAKILCSKSTPAMMATYAEDSQVEVLSRNASSGGLNRDIRTGKSEIQKLYDELFKTEGAIDARNVVDSARFLGSNLLLITGTLEISAGGQSSTFAFVQVRTKEADRWLLTNLQVFVVSDN
jgi:hypothetical protein